MSSSSITASSRDVILKAARTLISDRGYDGMVISDLSALSGLPASSIYYHFGNKLGILTALLEQTFEDLHATFPSPSSFDDREPIERFELWYTAACRSLDERPEYLRLLLAVSIGSHAGEDAIRVLVRRIRDYAHQSWIDALTPLFAPITSPEDEAFLDQLAVLGRAMTDGLSVSTTFDGGTYVAHVPPFVALVRGLAAERRGLHS
ncbi:TetR/AcrR family transcriptional regulator [Myceligenerans indicum]|uniref:TetR/AcrR family transcriptional regulator n=1 Tax=Myceligenerans indicum TaxID=2593663 RepID=UPI00191EC308|nr:TetR/AcrR family transcriptional regulator [Myceligenerans indicum]